MRCAASTSRSNAARTLGLIGESGLRQVDHGIGVCWGSHRDGATVSGSIRLQGRELVGASEAELCQVRGNRIAMIFQEPMTALKPGATRSAGRWAEPFAAASQGIGFRRAH